MALSSPCESQVSEKASWRWDFFYLINWPKNGLFHRTLVSACDQPAIRGQNENDVLWYDRKCGACWRGATCSDELLIVICLLDTKETRLQKWISMTQPARTRAHYSMVSLMNMTPPHVQVLTVQRATMVRTSVRPLRQCGRRNPANQWNFVWEGAYSLGPSENRTRHLQTKNDYKIKSTYFNLPISAYIRPVVVSDKNCSGILPKVNGKSVNPNEKRPAHRLHWQLRWDYRMKEDLVSIFAVNSSCDIILTKFFSRITFFQLEKFLVNFYLEMQNGVIYRPNIRNQFNAWLKACELVT